MTLGSDAGAADVGALYKAHETAPLGRTLRRQPGSRSAGGEWRCGDLPARESLSRRLRIRSSAFAQDDGFKCALAAACAMRQCDPVDAVAEPLIGVVAVDL